MRTTAGSNPFRRRQTSDEHPEPKDDTRDRPEDGQSTAIGKERRTTTPKRVRIQTPPPLSPDTPISSVDDPIATRLVDQDHSGSPPPISPAEWSVDSDEDPFNNEAATEVADPFSPNSELQANTLKNAETSTPAPNAVGGVINPFKRTLATLEPGRSEEIPERDVGTNANTSTGSNPPKAGIDVDSFTRMLMTGNSASKTEASGRRKDAQKGGVDHKGDNSSSSDVTAISRRSSSKEDVMLDSSGTDDSGVDEYEVNASQTGTRARSKPAPPKHRHGKSVAHSGPQIVSFSDFDVSEPQIPPSRPLRPPPKNLPPVPRTGPESPSLATSTYGSEEPTTSSERIPQKDTSVEPKDKRPSRSTPPPVPLTRRSTATQERRQNSPETSSIDSSRQSGSPATTAFPSLPTKTPKPPPPPPTRRSTPKNPTWDQNSISETGSTIESTPLTENISSVDMISEKRPSNAIQSSSRSSSISERPSMPPPPPPRRRGSSKSSMELAMARQNQGSPGGGRRTSQDSGRRTSGLNQVSAAGAGDRPGSEDVLADLTALQAEVDALRHSFRRLS